VKFCALGSSNSFAALATERGTLNEVDRRSGSAPSPNTDILAM
jgi:hypothetical protein